MSVIFDFLALVITLAIGVAETSAARLAVHDLHRQARRRAGASTVPPDFRDYDIGATGHKG